MTGRGDRPLTREAGGSGGDPDLPAVVAAQHDVAAFELLYRRYVGRVYSYTFYALGDHHDAEDATERAFLHALSGLAGYRDQGSSFRAWLFRIARNVVLNMQRSSRRRPTQPLADDAEVAATDADPAGVVAHADEVRRALAALRTLPDDRRQVVLLRFVNGLSAAEIGEITGRSPGAVRVLLHRALRDVAARLS